MLLIGITGAIGHGKTTLAETFGDIEPTAQHLESSLLIAEVANEVKKSSSTVPSTNDIKSINLWLKPLADALRTKTNFETTTTDIEIRQESIDNNPKLYEKLFVYIDQIKDNSSLLFEPVTTLNKQNHRALLQWLGGYIPERTSKDIWYKELVHRANRDKSSKLAVFGGVRYPADAKVIRESGGYIIEIQRPSLGQLDQDDPTERERSRVQKDTLIINDSSLDALLLCAKHVLQDIKTSRLKQQYKCSDFSNLS